MRWSEAELESHRKRMRVHVVPDAAARAAARAARRPKQKQVDKAEILREQLRLAGVEGWKGEYRFHPTRMWRLDVAFPVERIGVEIEGLGPRGTAGRHQRADGFADDCVKYAELCCLGWRLIRCTPKQVRSGIALQWIHRARLGSAP